MFQSCWDGATASWVLPVLGGGGGGGGGGVNMFCSRTQQDDPRGAPDRSVVRGVNHQATAPPLLSV